jgi:lipoate-protein ligase A
VQVERRTGRAATFHDLVIPADLTAARAWFFELERPALVLGSAQREDFVDTDAAAAAGVDIVRRHSGGGAVLLLPGACIWIDVLLPRSDPRWDDDVTRSGQWLGQLWADALTSVRVPASVHRSRLQSTPLGRQICFGSIGPGEVLDGAARKLVGVSQRRTRVGARFQCLVLRRWEPAALLRLLRFSEEDRRAAERDLADVATGVGGRLPDLQDAVLARLRTA